MEGPERAEDDRRSIATLVAAVRAAFDLFVETQAPTA